MMLSSGAQRGDATRCSQLGIAAYLLKPVRQVELRDAISRVLQTPEQSGEKHFVTAASLLRDMSPAKALHILVAEDNAVNQKLATRFLEKRGHTVTLAGNGKEALAASETTSFDLILMDVHMPEMDGIEATRGMDNYLSKPIRPQELDAVLDSYISAKSLVTATSAVTNFTSSVNIEELMERLDGDRELLAELTEIFRSDYPKQMQLAYEALADNDGPAVRRIGHALKGALANLGASNASELAFSIECMGKSGDLSTAEPALSDLQQSMSEIVARLEMMYAEQLV
jgi:CheY-like chemotaxis protein